MFIGSIPVERMGRVGDPDVGANVSDTLTVSQATHGFVVGEWVFNNAGTWTKAVASADTTLATDVVSNVVDVNTFVVTAGGYVTEPGHGKGTAGQALYVSQTVDGGDTTTPYVSGILQMVGEVINDGVYRVHIWVAQQL